MLASARPRRRQAAGPGRRRRRSTAARPSTLSASGRPARRPVVRARGGREHGHVHEHLDGAAAAVDDPDPVDRRLAVERLERAVRRRTRAHAGDGPRRRAARSGRQAIDPRTLSVEFDASISGGSGADGLALVIGDAARRARARPRSASRGGGLGFSGIPGLAVALDEYKNTVNPSDNFIGISDGPIATPPPTAALARDREPRRPLQGADAPRQGRRPRRDDDRLDRRHEVLSQAVTLPPSAFLGFSAGTGGATNRHAISHLVVKAGSEAPAARDVADRQLGPGSERIPQAAATFPYNGTCPSSFTTAGLANSGTASPSLSGAVAGASCAITETVPAPAAGAQWTVTASVNGGAAQTLSVVEGKAVLTTFALKAGANTVAFTNSYQAATAIVPNPAAGGWTLNGTASLTGSSLQLTPASGTSAGSAFWPQTIDPRALKIEYDATIGGGSGADGIALVFADPSKGATPTSLGVPAAAWASPASRVRGRARRVQERVNPSNNFVGVTMGPRLRQQTCCTGSERRRCEPAAGSDPPHPRDDECDRHHRVGRRHAGPLPERRFARQRVSGLQRRHRRADEPPRDRKPQRYGR